MNHRLPRILPLLLAGFFLTGCGTPPHQIEPTGDEKVTSMGVDYDGILTWSESLTRRMLASGFLEAEAYQPHPVRMVISDIENRTDLPGLPTEMLIGRIRSVLLSSGKVRVLSSYGREATDTMVDETDDVARDPRFENPDWQQEEGRLSLARLSLRAQVLFHASRAGRARQNTYEVRLFVSDLANGEVVWEGFSDPIAKKSVRPGIGP